MRVMPDVPRFYIPIGAKDLVAVFAVGSLPDVNRVTDRIQKIHGVLAEERACYCPTS